MRSRLVTLPATGQTVRDIRKLLTLVTRTDA